MRKYEAQIVPATTRKVQVGTFCDRCDKDIHDYDKQMYYVREADFRFACGTVYPEGGSVFGWEIQDVCDECVADMRVLLSANGFKISSVEDVR